jgi:Xaa-Pro dipeptidase
MQLDPSTTLQEYRLERIRAELIAQQIDAVVLFDPINIRYATGSRNMQVWTMHNYCRYVYLSATGQVVLFELPSSSHLAKALHGIDEIRPSLAWDYMMVGNRGEEMALRWATEIVDLVTQHIGNSKRIALDRADFLASENLKKLGANIFDGKGIMEHARAVKSEEEIVDFTHSLRSAEQAIHAMRQAIKPGMTESAALSILIQKSIELGGEYPETRLLSSGPRTNPWFQETSDRAMLEGDLISFDTDLIGPGGFYNDISRSWIVGEKKPNDTQRRLYATAHAQLQHNIALLKAGSSFLDYSDKSFTLADEYVKNRYADVAHGCGFGVEYPLIWYREDAEYGAYDGYFEANMIVCVEAYVGHEHGTEGVKLEQPVLITEHGPNVLSEYPLETDYL